MTKRTQSPRRKSFTRDFLSVCAHSSRSGHLWSAKWWSYGSVPGGNIPALFCTDWSLTRGTGTENDWNDEGACGAGLVSVESVGGPKYEEKSVPTVVPNSVPTSGAQGAKRSRVYRA